MGLMGLVGCVRCRQLPGIGSFVWLLSHQSAKPQVEVRPTTALRDLFLIVKCSEGRRLILEPRESTLS